MPDKLEVVPGPGLVARFGDIAVWAGPQASPALQSHLVSEAQRAAQSANPADQLASSFIAVLQRGDPEPQAPFAIAGGGSNGTTLFLHGPVQAWDSGRWLAPQPVPGWLLTSIGRPWPLIILPYGASPPPPSQQGNPFDLTQGAVPGAGFVLLRTAGTAAGGPAPYSVAAPSGLSPVGPSPFSHGSPQAQAPQAQAPQAFVPPGHASGDDGGQTFSGPEDVASRIFSNQAFGGASAAPQTFDVPAPQPASAPGSSPAGASSGAAVATTSSVGAPVAYPPPMGDLADLRSVAGPEGPALGLASDWQPAAGPHVPTVVGRSCDRGHFNHPRAVTCMRCGRAIPAGTAQLSGPRPPAGVLLADDGSLWSVAQGCAIGADPSSAAAVRSGTAQPVQLRAGTNQSMAPVHAEIQLRDWDAYLVDGRADGGTFAQAPGEQSWRQLGWGEQRVLPSGSHVSCGGRVLTFLSAWPV